MKMSYMVGFGDHFPNKVHHRSASILWDGQLYSCAERERWRKSVDPNPNVLSGAMAAGPDQFDHFIDERDQPLFTEPTISSYAGLVAAPLHDPPRPDLPGVAVRPPHGLLGWPCGEPLWVASPPCIFEK
ncbi:hypothetical protein FH972_005062 [Carpinus fangiana]|uniref:cellulase n=1 Tax=Carpinus fangiana TaxID=176857 RepID=A0A5N6QQY8_9ROSI|nr:hypothetical protein FH972_005062 [Carpinus fangiana]